MFNNRYLPLRKFLDCSLFWMGSDCWILRSLLRVLAGIFFYFYFLFKVLYDIQVFFIPMLLLSRNFLSVIRSVSWLLNRAGHETFIYTQLHSTVTISHFLNYSRIYVYPHKYLNVYVRTVTATLGHSEWFRILLRALHYDNVFYSLDECTLPW